MKKRLNQQVINSDTTGTGGHQYAVGNVMYVKKDIKLNDSQIIVSTAGTFNVAVYEWQDGKGVVGQPIWKKDAYYDVGTYTYPFGGLILREGKKYWFGRYDDTNGAKVGRTIGLGTVDYKTISTYGGARFTDSDIAFGTTYYYFYGLEVEDLDMRISTSYAGAMKPAILYPKKNLFNGITEKGSFDSVGAIGDNSVNVRGIQFIPVRVGKTYTFSVKDKPGIWPRFYWYDEDKNFISSALGYSQTAPARASYLRWHTGSTEVSDLVQIEEGSTITYYEPYELVIKPL
jgi:hypothetical protein